MVSQFNLNHLDQSLLFHVFQYFAEKGDHAVFIAFGFLMGTGGLNFCQRVSSNSRMGYFSFFMRYSIGDFNWRFSGLACRNAFAIIIVPGREFCPTYPSSRRDDSCDENRVSQPQTAAHDCTQNSSGYHMHHERPAVPLEHRRYVIFSRMGVVARSGWLRIST